MCNAFQTCRLTSLCTAQSVFAQNNMKYRALLLFGAPGTGKGTQGKVLGTIPGFFHCACGDVFRSLTPDSRIGSIFLEYSKRGELVPDELTVELWAQYIATAIRAERFRPETDTLVLDGIPRCIRQAQILENTLDVKSVIHLCCTSHQTLVARIQRRAQHDNRLDDAKLEVIKNRLVIYERETEPLLGFYDKGLVRRIDAAQTPCEVLLDILTILVSWI